MLVRNLMLFYYLVVSSRHHQRSPIFFFIQNIKAYTRCCKHCVPFRNTCRGIQRDQGYSCGASVDSAVPNTIPSPHSRSLKFYIGPLTMGSGVIALNYGCIPIILYSLPYQVCFIWEYFILKQCFE